MEGLTTYYTDLVLRRAGLLSQEKYLARLAELIEKLEKMPGRRHQSLAESSFDAWIRFYRPDENSGNAQISYYHKGALVGMLLDMEIRRATRGARSLDDVMKVMWERFGKVELGYPEGELERVAEEVAGVELGWFFDRYVRGVEELDYDRALEVVGLRLVRGGEDAVAARSAGEGAPIAGEAGAPIAGGVIEGGLREHGAEAAPSDGEKQSRSEGQGGTVPARAERAPAAARASEGNGGVGVKLPDVEQVEARLGLRLKEAGGRVEVQSVVAGGPGYRAGMDSGDEVVAVGGYRVGSVAEVAGRLEGVAAGARVEVLGFRRGELMRWEVEVGAEGRRWRVVPRGA